MVASFVHAAAGEAPVVLVTAQRGGVEARGVGAGGGLLVYDITLSPLQHGLPAEAAQLRDWLLGCLLLAALAMCFVPTGGEFARHPAHRYLERRRARQIGRT